MRIHLHLGMPKTGTSSIQSVLLKTYGSREPQRIWYPMPETMGDGHADLVFRAIGYGGQRPEPRILEDVARRALDAGCQDLILDSETLIYAVLSHHRSLISALAKFGDVMPIVTLTPIGKRASSIWQEMVKNLVGASLEQSRNLVADGLVDLQFIETLTEILPDCAVSVICVDGTEDSGAIFRHLATVTGLELPASALDGREARSNRSLLRLEADVMAGLSESYRHRVGSEIEYRHAQFKLLHLFESEDWRAMSPVTPVAFPHDWASWISELAARTISGLRALENAGRVRILGDIDRLDDVLRPHKWPDVQIHRGAPMVAATIITTVPPHRSKLHEMLHSAWSQSFIDFELLILGGSRDEATRAAVLEIASRDPRVRYLECPDESDVATSRHLALGEARGRFVAYLDEDNIWLPHHLQTLSDLLQEADFVHGLQASVGKSGALSISPSDLSNPDLRDFLMTTDYRGFGIALIGHRLDAYRRLPGGWHTVPKAAPWPDIAMWRQFLAEPWCRARSASMPTGISLDEGWRTLLAPAEFAEQLAHLRSICADPSYIAKLNREALGSLNAQSVAAQMARWQRDGELRKLIAGSAIRQEAAMEQQALITSVSRQMPVARQTTEADDKALCRAERKVARLQRELQFEKSRRVRLKQSLSWRLTRPFRRLRRKLSAVKV